MKVRYWIAATFLAIGWFAYTHPPTRGSAPTLIAKTIAGQNIDLHAMKGKPILVSFWATSCPACTRKIPDMAKLYKKYPRDQFEIIAVSMSYDQPDQVLRFIQEHQLPWPVVLDHDGSIARSFGEVSLIPANFLISPEGEVIQHDIGELDFQQTEKNIHALL